MMDEQIRFQNASIVRRTEVLEALLPDASPQETSDFLADLSKELKANSFPGYHLTRGRFGGICRVATLPPAPPPLEPLEEPPPVPLPVESRPLAPSGSAGTYPRHVWVGRKHFLVPGSFARIDRLMHILGGKGDPQGTVVYNGKRHACPHEQIFEEILVQLFGAYYREDSDPQASIDGVPVELAIP